MKIFRNQKGLNKERQKKLKAYERRLGVKYRDLSLLNQALTHSSYANETQASKDNETLEFLGDAVLGLITNDYLYNYFEDSTEGEMSRIKSAVVSEKSLAEMAKKMYIQEYLMLGKGEEQTGGRLRDAILADSVEAILGSYYLDRGLEAARKFILPYLIDSLEKYQTDPHLKDYKTHLQLYTQKLHKTYPRYKTIKEEGPDHQKIFFVHVILHGNVIGEGKGKNKKSAQQNAAKNAMTKLGLILND